MADSVDSPAPLRTTTSPPRKTSTIIPNVLGWLPGSAVSGSVRITLPCCLIFRFGWESRNDGWVCTVVLSFEPGERAPLLLLGVRDELKDRPWLPPARHWPGSPLLGGLDQQAGGTWLAVHPDVPRVACLLNGRGIQALSARPTGPDRPPGPA